MSALPGASGSTPLRTYERMVRLPTQRIDRWDLIARVTAVVQQNAAESEWQSPKLTVEVIDEGGSYRTESVAEAEALARASRHRVTAVTFSFWESGSAKIGRSVRGCFGDPAGHRSLTVSGPRESEVVGLASLLTEVLAMPQDSTDTPALGRHIGRWWTSRHVGTQLLVGVLASLIASALVWLLLVLL